MDDLCPIGRAEAWAAITTPVRERRTALVAVSSLPGSGRTMMFTRLGEYGRRRGFRVLGAERPLQVEPTTRIRDVRRALRAILPGSPVADGDSTDQAKSRLGRALAHVDDWIDLDDELSRSFAAAAPVVVLVDGYQASTSVETWLLARLVPIIRRTAGTVLLVVGGSPDAVARVAAAADVAVTLGSLDATEVRAHLEEVTAEATPPLSEAELEAYAEAGAADTAVLGALELVFETSLDPHPAG